MVQGVLEKTITGEIKADSRHVARRMRTAMHGDIIRVLVELITNSDDSYIRLENGEKTKNCKIEILYNKDSINSASFAVRDFAEGMSRETIQKNFTSYGAATSGLKEGKKVRGYFGQGAKDALIAMSNGMICSFKDDEITQCKIFWKNNKEPYYEISHVPKDCRSAFGIKGNGTIASFKAEKGTTSKAIPKFDKIHELLANNYILRKIMMNPSRHVVLIDTNSGKHRRLQYKSPEGELILSEQFKIKFGKYSTFNIKMQLYRASHELNQTGDDRDGGLLLVDEFGAVLGISLFKFNSDPNASKFFGEVVIEGFRQLLENEEAVLSEEREGLVPRHPFCQKLIDEIEKRLELKVREEALRRQKEEANRFDNEETNKYKNAFDILNDIAEEEIEEIKNLGDTTSDKISVPEQGFLLHPEKAEITVNKTYNFTLYIDTNKFDPGAIFKISVTTPKLHCYTEDIKLAKTKNKGIVKKYIKLQGKESGTEGKLIVSFGKNKSESEVFIVPEKSDKDLLFTEGMIFEPASLTLRPNQPRKVSLKVYVKKILSGSTIKLVSENESIKIDKEEIKVNDAEAIRHLVKYELEVWGEGVGKKGWITAISNDDGLEHTALLEVQIKSANIEEKDKNRNGMFSEPEFSLEHDPLQRASYSSESGKVIIYVNFPSNKLYLGKDGIYRKTLPGQILIADLVAERCFNEIAKKKFETSGISFTAEGKYDRMQRDAFALSKKYGLKVHKALVDQKLLSNVQEVGINSNGTDVNGNKAWNRSINK